MPSEFTHIFVSTALGKISFNEKLPARFWLLTAIGTVLPDIDVIGYYYGIKYGDVLGHRGFTHSLTFALLASTLVVLVAFPALSRFSKRWWWMLAFFFVVIASHGVLDAMTDKGMGVGFFSPFDNTRYFMPWRPIFASPMRISRFFSHTGIEVLTKEIIWIWTPLLLVYAGVSMYRKSTQL
jgi:inner membrane protein